MPVQVGVDKLHYAICTQDDAGGVAYQNPVAIPGAIKIGVDPGGSVDVLYADDGPSEAASVVGAIKVSLNVKDLTLETQAALLGHSLVGGVLVQKTTDSAPDVAILFRSRKSNGKYRYIKLLKGKFTVPKTDYETQEDKTKYQTPTMTSHAAIGKMLRNTHYLGDDYYPAIIDAGTFETAETERIKRAEKLGRVYEPKGKNEVVYPTAFRIKEGSERFDDPFQQAEYAYSLIESEV